MKKIKLLIVEDSLIFREIMLRKLSSDMTIEVVKAVADPYEARDSILKYHPDVMTLDINLPKMNGIEFLRRLLPQYMLPVVVVSALSQLAEQAIEAGAVDFVSKPMSSKIEDIEYFVEHELAAKIKIASIAKLGKAKNSNIASQMSSGTSDGRIIAIGASTGGTEAIFNVVKGFQRNIPGIVIVQHMPAGFTKMYAERLNNQCMVAAKEAVTGDIVIPGRILLAPGDAHMRLVKIGSNYQVECKPGEKVSGHCPSVDVLFESVAKIAGKKAIGILLTGMGADGAKGLLAMKQAGAETIGQDEASCVVYGMPKVAYQIGAVKYQVALENISNKVYNILNMSRE